MNTSADDDDAAGLGYVRRASIRDDALLADDWEAFFARRKPRDDGGKTGARIDPQPRA